MKSIRMFVSDFDVAGVLQILQQSGEIHRWLNPGFGELVDFVQFFEGLVDLKKTNVSIYFEEISSFPYLGNNGIRDRCGRCVQDLSQKQWFNQRPDNVSHVATLFDTASNIRTIHFIIYAKQKGIESQFVAGKISTLVEGVD